MEATHRGGRERGRGPRPRRAARSRRLPFQLLRRQGRRRQDHVRGRRRVAAADGRARASSSSPRIPRTRWAMRWTGGSPRCRAGSRRQAARAADRSTGAAPGTLDVVELDADRALERWIGERRVASQIVGRGTYLDDDDIEALLRLAFPGRRRAHRAARADAPRRVGPYPEVVVDTAPTGPYAPAAGHARHAPTHRGHPRRHAGQAPLPGREPRRTLPGGRQRPRHRRDRGREAVALEPCFAIPASARFTGSRCPKWLRWRKRATASPRSPPRASR